MSRFAIIIGVNNYRSPTPALEGAVQDAIDFAEWAINEGGVPASNVWLLLGYDAATPPKTPADVKLSGATRDEILSAIGSVKAAAAQGGERLYVYFAGHGLSAPGVSMGLSPEPVLLPSGVADPTQLPDRGNLLSFSTFLSEFKSVLPSEQLFFFDACRGLELENINLPAIGSAVGAPISVSPGTSLQYVLYSTSLGQQAFEAGQGVFNKALLEGLRGAFQALHHETSVEPPRYEVRFTTLVEYVQQRVKKIMDDYQAGLSDSEKKPVQLPRGVPPDSGEDAALATFSEPPMMDISVLVDPDATLDTCSVAISYYGRGNRLVLWEKSSDLPLPYPVKFKVAPGSYVITAEARYYNTGRELWTPWKDSEIDFTLESQPDSSIGGAVIEGGGTDGHADNGGDVDSTNGGAGGWMPGHGGVGVGDRNGSSFRVDGSTSRGLESFPGDTSADDMNIRIGGGGNAVPPPTATGSLEISSKDRTAHLVLLDPGKNVVAIEQGYISRDNLQPGIYEASMRQPEGTVKRLLVEVQPGKPTRAEFDAPEPSLGKTQMNMLAQLGIHQDDKGYFHPSERLGAISNLKLASLLGFAAYAAQYQGNDFQRLRSFGVDPMNHVPPGQSGLRVLIGVSTDSAISRPGLNLTDFLTSAKVSAFQGARKEADDLDFEVLSGFGSAAQGTLILKPGPVHLELQVLERANTRYALYALPDRVTTFIVVATEDGGFEIQQYILPVSRQGPDTLYQSDSNIRRIELAQRYYSVGSYDSLADSDLADMLNGKWLDPLLGCLAGYSLIRLGRHERYSSYALRNMLRHFSSLPDSHVLAGLCEPERRGEHYANALKHGLPIFTEGLRALHDWLQEEKSETPAVIAEAARGLLPGSPWTAWTLVRPALLFQKGTFSRPPSDWTELEEKRAEIEELALSVGKIEIAGGLHSWAGTGFMVGERIIMTARTVAGAFCKQDELGYWRFMKNVSARIDFQEGVGSEQRLEFAIQEIIGVHEKLDLALFRIADQSSNGSAPPKPIPVASTVHRRLKGRKVYTIGYPGFDSRIDSALQRVFASVYEAKRLLPGEISGSDKPKKELHHDCFTAGGSAGACVIDLDTSQAIGLHFGGRSNFGGYYKYNYAVALWLLANDPLLRGVVHFV